MKRSHVLLLSVCLLVASVASAAPRRIPINDASLVVGQSSNPQQFVTVGSQVFFTAGDGTHGSELWRTDGTAAGTRLVKDVNPGTEGSEATLAGAMGNVLVFTATTGTTRQLWRSDGTAAGTFVLGTVPPSANLGGYYVMTIPAGTRVFLMVRQHYSEPWDLFVSSGVAGDLRKVGTYAIGFEPIPYGKDGKLYFVVEDPVVQSQFFVSDGTAAGTGMIQRGLECVNGYCAGVLFPRTIFQIGSKLLFTTSTGLWTTDGTAAGTKEIKALGETWFIAAGKTAAYLEAGGHLWRTDGTAAGTTDAGPRPAGTIHRVLDDGTFVFWNYGATAHIWKSDGTPAGTREVVAAPYALVWEDVVGALGTRLLVAGDDPARGIELSYIDVATGAFGLVKDLDPRIVSGGGMASNPANGAGVGSQVVFPATDYTGRELWATDGTAAGTKFLANIASEPAGGMISGTIRDKVTNTPVAGAYVRVCPTATKCEETVYTSEDGGYTFFGVIPATYFIFAGGGSHLPQSYGGEACPCPDVRGTPVTVSAGTHTLSVDFSLTRAGSISGRITRLKDGEPVYTGVRLRKDGKITHVSGTGIDGRYVFSPLAAGSYTVETATSSYPYYDPPLIDQVYGGATCPSSCDGIPGTAVAVTLGQETANIDLALHSYGRISGTVTDADFPAKGIGGTGVTITPADGVGSAQMVWTTHDGKYLSPGLRPGSYYVHAAGHQSQNYAGMVYPDKPCPTGTCDLTGATPLAVPMDGEPVADLRLPQVQGRLAGIIRDSGGVALPNVYVKLLDQNGTEFRLSGQSFTRTGADGRFALHSIPAGTYYLHAAGEVHGNVPCVSDSCNVSGATPLVMQAGKTTSVEMRLLSRLSTFSGRITDAVTGYGIMSAVVRLTAANGFLHELKGDTAPDGRYSVSYLGTATSFYLRVDAHAHHTFWWPGVKQGCDYYYPCTPPAGAVTLPAGNHTDVDLALPRLGVIRGRVTDARTGLPLHHQLVHFSTAVGIDGSDYTDQEGRFEFFPPGGSGSYYVWIQDGRYRGQVYPNVACGEADCVQNGTLVTVPDEGERTGIDFQLTSVEGVIRGRIVDDATGAPVTGAHVTARIVRDSSLSTIGSASTDADGLYSIDVPYIGTYQLSASAAPPYFTAVYGGSHCSGWDDCNFGGGTAVAVQSDVVTGIDLRLIRLQVSSISPAQASTAGGTQVTVRGANFTPGTTLEIGGKPATIVSRTSAKLVAVVPAAPVPGPAHVTVRVSPGLFITFAHAFTYNTQFTDHPLVAGQTHLRAVHILELRQAVNSLRASANLAAFAFTDPALAGTPVKAAHLLELRTALNQARAALGRPALTYANAIARGARVRAADIMELRAGVN
jgi:ELWxxDGT repeat protein